MLRNQGCLARLPQAERRVLRLRAGVGIAHPRSRAQVMRITGLSRKRVIAIERSGMKRMRTMAQAGDCGRGSGAATESTQATPAAGAPGRNADLRHSPRIAVRGEREAGGAPAPQPESPPGEHRPLLGAPDDARDLAPIVLAVALAALLFVLIRQARKEHLSD